MIDQSNSELSNLFMMGAERMMDATFVFIRKSDLTLVQMNLLFYIYYQGPKEVTKLTEPLQTTKGAVSQLVERMVCHDLLSRTESTEDRRSKIIDLTEKGKKFVLGAIDCRRVWVNEKLDKLSVEQVEELENAAKIINEKLGLVK